MKDRTSLISVVFFLLSLACAFVFNDEVKSEKDIIAKSER